MTKLIISFLILLLRFLTFRLSVILDLLVNLLKQKRLVFFGLIPLILLFGVLVLLILIRAILILVSLNVLRLEVIFLINKFASRYGKHGRFPSTTGKPTRIVYTPKYDKHGTLELEPISEENIYEQIQSHKDSVDIGLIIKRFQTTGDPSILERIQKVYGDFTNMPKTPQEVLNLNIAAHSYFDHLSVDEKAKYGNSYERFLVEYKPKSHSESVPPESELVVASDSALEGDN